MLVTVKAYEAMRQKDKKLHEAARKIIKELIRSNDPAVRFPIQSEE